MEDNEGMCQEHREEVTSATPSPELVPQNKSTSLVGGLIAKVMIAMVRFYQRGISPLLGKNCRYEPTCSQYFILAVQKYGPLRGAWKGFWRIMRCHPFRPGGFDPP
jgi:putative membrane protein insertion efficiency factor